MLWVFFNVPYDEDPEIGAMDGDFVPEFPDPGAEMSLFGRYPENREKRSFSDRRSENNAF